MKGQVGELVTLNCVGGGWHDCDIQYPVQEVETVKISIPFTEGCGCSGMWVYEVYGELAIAAYYEPPELHHWTPNYVHPDAQ